jgi:hypothetical protein
LVNRWISLSIMVVIPPFGLEETVGHLSIHPAGNRTRITSVQHER